MTKSGQKRLLQMALLSILIVAISAATVTANENLTANFLDVGQGDSILLQFAGENVLIDGGTEDAGPRVESYL
jgi:competence protein ComEC